MIEDPTKGRRQDAEDIRNAAMVRIDLATQGGGILMEIVEAHLAERIESLVVADPEAQAYLNILRTVGYQIRLGAGKSAKSLARLAKEGD